MFIILGLVVFLLLQFDSVDAGLRDKLFPKKPSAGSSSSSEASCFEYSPELHGIDRHDKDPYFSFLEAVDHNNHNPCENFYNYACHCFDYTFRNNPPSWRYNQLQAKVDEEVRKLVMEDPGIDMRMSTAVQKMIKFRDACLNVYNKDENECFKDTKRYFFVVFNALYAHKYWDQKTPDEKKYIETMFENIKRSLSDLFDDNKSWLDANGKKYWKKDHKDQSEVPSETPYEHAKRKLADMKAVIGNFPQLSNYRNLDNIHAHYVVDVTQKYEELTRKLNRFQQEIPIKLTATSQSFDGVDPSKIYSYSDHYIRDGSHATLVNANYVNDINMIFIHAAILQPPVFDYRLPDAVNYARIGSVIGHEITHGFDKLGCQFDVNGNKKEGGAKSSWMDDKTKKTFDDRIAKLNQGYKSEHALPHHMSGMTNERGEKIEIDADHTSSENVADQGGIRIAYNALTKLKMKPFYCDTRSRPEPENVKALKRQLMGGDGKDKDVHAPKYARVNAVLRKFEKFKDTYVCRPIKDHKAMFAKKPFSVWSYKSK